MDNIKIHAEIANEDPALIRKPSENEAEIEKVKENDKETEIDKNEIEVNENNLSEDINIIKSEK